MPVKVTNPDGQSATGEWTYEGQVGPHAYFDMLKGMPEIFKSWSLRTQAEVNKLQPWGDAGWWKVTPDGNAVYLDMPQMRRYQECPLVYGKCKVTGVVGAIIPEGTMAVNPVTGYTYRCAGRYIIPSTGINIGVRFDAANPANYLAEVPVGTHLTITNSVPGIQPDIVVAPSDEIEVKCSDSVPIGNQLKMMCNIKQGESMFLTWDFMFDENWRTSAKDLSAFKVFKIQAGEGTNIHGGWWTIMHHLQRRSTDLRTIGPIHQGIGNDDTPQGQTDGKPLSPTNAAPANSVQIHHSVYTRYWVELKVGVPSEAFVEWNTRYNAGVPIRANTNDPNGLWHMASMWVADETRPPVAILYRAPVYGDGGEVCRFDFEMNTSDLAPSRSGPFTGLGRNVAILKNFDLPDNGPTAMPWLFPQPVR